MFAFESDLKIKTEFKIETAEGIENKKIEIHPNQRPKLKTKVKVRKELKSCNFCDKTFNNLISLENHKRIHGELKCRFCDKKFITKGTLTNHERASHVKKQLYECKFCNGLFMSSNTLDSHIKIHENNQ